MLRSPVLAASGIDGARVRFTDLRQIGARVERREGALLALARARLFWHARHRFCGLCSSPTRSEEAGHMRRCSDPACDTMHFPRTDPAVIMLVCDGERAPLGCNKNFPVPGMYSTLAGFVEPGESLEDAVGREVREETGIEVEAVYYHSSQPGKHMADIEWQALPPLWPETAVWTDVGEFMLLAYTQDGVPTWEVSRRAKSSSSRDELIANGTADTFEAAKAAALFEARARSSE